MLRKLLADTYMYMYISYAMLLLAGVQCIVYVHIHNMYAHFSLEK